MIVEDQHELIEFLSQPSAYPASVDAVERIDTHSATVFLAGRHAYKLKRAVRYDYLDFSTLARRRTFCEAEVAVNRRTAPGLYLGVVPVTWEQEGRLAIGGAGEPIEWLVFMRRFPDDQLFDRLAARGALEVGLMPLLARAIARLHATAEQRPDKGGFDGLRWVVDGNERGLAEQGAGVLDEALCARVIERSRTALDRHAPLLESRRQRGCVRVCHGDLHLGNIVLLDREPVLFDAVEFNDDISCIDVLYDAAFLLMDLWRLDLRPHANELFNTYVSESFSQADAYGALALLPLFLSCRSAVRAKTNATASRLQEDRVHADALAVAARTYLAEADAVLHPAPPCLIAVGGVSGSGKSTAARRIAASVGGAPGALIVRSDVVRKRLAGVDETIRLGPEAYGADMNTLVYRTLIESATRALQAGHAVIVDAVFGKDEERRLVEAAARVAGAPFAGVWLDAPRDVLAARVDARSGDASDATAVVVDAQLQRGTGYVTWTTVDAAADAGTVERRVRRVVDRML